MTDLVREVRGTVTLMDGSTSRFRVHENGEWQQWGDVSNERLRRTAGTVEAVSRALRDRIVSTFDVAWDEDDHPEACVEADEVWDNDIARQLRDALLGRGAEKAAQWLYEHEGDDFIWDTIGDLLDEIERLAHKELGEEDDFADAVRNADKGADQ